MTLAALGIAIIVGLLVNEMSDISPWAARKLVVWSAHLRYAGLPRAEIRSEELAALINERPGKLLKLCTAIGFILASIADRLRKRMTGNPDPEPGPLDGVSRILRRWDEPSRLVARYLYPTERYRGEWRRHIVKPLAELGLGISAGYALWHANELRLRLPEVGGFASREFTFEPTTVQIAIAVVGWSLWRLVAWRFNRFSLTNKRLMMVKGVFLRRVAMAPIGSTSGLTYRQMPLGRLLNYGTFTLHSVGLIHPLRRIRYLPKPNELYLRALEEAFDPNVVEARLGSYDPDDDPEAARDELAPEQLPVKLDLPRGAAWERPGPVHHMHAQIVLTQAAFTLAAAMTTDVWPLVRDTVGALMRGRHIEAGGQLDADAHRVGSAAASDQIDVQRELADTWRVRLDLLCDPYLVRELQAAGPKLHACLPEPQRQWVAEYLPDRRSASGSADEDSNRPAHEAQREHLYALPPAQVTPDKLVELRSSVVRGLPSSDGGGGHQPNASADEP